MSILIQKRCRSQDILTKTKNFTPSELDAIQHQLFLIEIINISLVSNII